MAPGGVEEVEIRAAVVQAVEMLREWYKGRGRLVQAYEIDWFLWQLGEDSRKDIQPHHRVKTIFY